MTAPEPPQAHRPAARQRVDFIVPLAALFVSFVSILIAWYSASIEKQMARQNERMVQASSLPRLAHQTSTLTRESGLDRISLSITNQGVGPAEVRSVEMIVDGVPVRGPLDLLERFRIPGGELSLNGLSNVMIRPGDKITYFDLNADPSIARQVAQLVDKAQTRKIVVKFCYCSVFDECWLLPREGARPERVRQCTPPKVRYDRG